jgi:hypothetical protein
MTTTIQVPAKTIPKIWNLDLPKKEEFIEITITIPEEKDVIPDKEVDAQITNGECTSFDADDTDGIMNFFDKLIAKE